MREKKSETLLFERYGKSDSILIQDNMVVLI